jgi:DNA polymerase-3 subunit epsilon
VAVTIAEYSGLRTCTTRLPRAGRHECPPAVVGGCPAAVVTGIPINREEYASAPAAVRALFAGHSDALLCAMLERIETHSRAEHFEAAARQRDRVVRVIRALHRTQRLAAIAGIAELIAAHPDGVGGWEFAVIRYGRLAGAGNAARGVSPMPVVERIVAAAETVIPIGADAGAGALRSADAELLDATPAAVDPGSEVMLPIDGTAVQSLPGGPEATLVVAGVGAAALGNAAPNVPPLRGASPEEVALVARWLARPGVRIVRTTEGYREPAHGAGRWMGWVELADAAARAKLPEQEYADRLG